MGKTISAIREQYPDLMVYNDEHNEVYTKDSLISGIYRFTETRIIDGGLGGIFGGDFINTSGDTYMSLDPSLFKKSSTKWDIQKACNWLHRNSKSASQHVCAKYVRMAIEAGGLSTNGRPSWAYQYTTFLPKIGFRCIGKIKRNDKNYRPEPGDIAVYQKNGDPKVPGHICMWTGAYWASDFKQNSMIVYQGTPEAYVFRFEA